MKRLSIGLGLFAALAVIGFLGLAAWPISRTPSPSLATLDGNVQNGAYLARASGCIACHTNPEGGAPLAGGIALETPFGTLYSPNLTTDPVHGIGDWTIDQFAVAVRQGISPEGEPYYPAFTYPFYADFSDQDIADLWAAFQTVPPVAEPSIAPNMMFPFNQRAGLKLWRAAFMYDPDTEPVEGKSDSWNRGKWLVEGATHCSACHTPRNLAGGRKEKTEKFAGSDLIPGGGKAPAIDKASLMNQGWDADSLAYALKTGLTPSGDAFGNAMGEVVLHGTQFLSTADLAAMAEYLMDQPRK